MALGLPKRKPKEGKKVRKARLKLEAQRVQESLQAPKEEAKVTGPKQRVEVPSVITVRDFAAVIGIPVVKIITVLLKNGVPATINESIDFDTAAILGDELGFEIVRKGEVKEEGEAAQEGESGSRPPVITVMGHVDHGKTALLDAIRKTNVMATESGGITQHIGAYQVEVTDKKGATRKLTFLDTPGHQAFSAMRAHGANVTDIVILVVAADDGVKPQTVEAYTHARAANVPIIVAINKADLPAANLDKVKRELSDLGLIPEEWGGKTVMLPVSAKTGQGVEDLLEMIALTSDIAKLTARITGPATGVIIESQIHKGLGPIATVLIREGILSLGDIVVAGQAMGRVRTIEDDQGKRLKQASPGMPVRISGLADVPSVGDIMTTATDEKMAREKTQRVTRLGRPTLRLSELSATPIQEGTLTLTIILKADVTGSLDAIKKSLSDLASSDVNISIVLDGVGPITDSDVSRAIATGSMIVGFKVPVLPAAQRLADEKNVKIAVYDIIYQLIDDIVVYLESMLPPEIIESELGRLQITHLFKQTANRQVVGGKVTRGQIEKGPADVMRDGQVVGKGDVQSVQIEKSVVPVAKEGSTPGLLFIPTGTSVKMKAGDSIVVKRTERRVRHLKKPN